MSYYLSVIIDRAASGKVLLPSEGSFLRSEVASLIGERDRLLADVARLDDSNERLTKEAEMLKAHMGKLTDHLIELQAGNGRLTEEAEMLKAQLSQAELNHRLDIDGL